MQLHELPFNVGEAVMFTGLKSQQFNGQNGTITRFDSERMRYAVQLASGREIFVKAKNLNAPFEYKCDVFDPEDQAGHRIVFEAYQELCSDKSLSVQGLLRIKKLSNHMHKNLDVNEVAFVEFIRVWWIKIVQYNSPQVRNEVNHTII